MEFLAESTICEGCWAVDAECSESTVLGIYCAIELGIFDCYLRYGRAECIPTVDFAILDYDSTGSSIRMNTVSASIDFAVFESN